MYGVASTARDLIVRYPDPPARVAARMLYVVRALEFDPASSRLWLVYADLSWQMGLPVERVWGALDTAQLTGRREEEVMAFNALQTIRLWEVAGALRKERALAAIAELRWPVLSDNKEVFTRVLASKSNAIRAEIGAALKERLGKDKNLLDGVGL